SPKTPSSCEAPPQDDPLPHGPTQRHAGADFTKSFGDTVWRRRARIHPLDRRAAAQSRRSSGTRWPIVNLLWVVNLAVGHKGPLPRDRLPRLDAVALLIDFRLYELRQVSQRFLPAEVTRLQRHDIRQAFL